MTEIDEKDLKIMEAMNKFGPKISTEELSKKLEIPSRTIRYRILKLKENGYIKPMSMLTHERKLGLGENFIILDINQSKEKELKKILDKITYFYSYISTYGKYNGYLTRFIFSLNTPRFNFEILEAMKRKNFINDYCIFDIIDYKTKSKNLHYFNLDKGWVWNWENWYETIKERLQKRVDFSLKFDEGYIADFDYKDVILLKNLIGDATTTIKELSKTLSLSETQVRKRIHKLERQGIIKDYNNEHNLPKNQDSITIFCFFEVSELTNNILSCFYELPYKISVYYESPSKFCIQLGLNAKDMRSFLKGFDLLRPHLKSYFFQFGYDSSRSDVAQLFDLFNKDTNSWKTPIQEFIAFIEKVIS